MSQPATVHHTFVLERKFPQSPERVFAALSNPQQKRRWFAEGSDHEIVAFESDFHVGGADVLRYRMGAATPFPGVELVNEGRYQDIVPNRRVVIASHMSLGERRISASLVTMELLPEGSGTAFLCTHQGAFFEGADGPERRTAGWTKLLDRLTAELSRG